MSYVHYYTNHNAFCYVQNKVSNFYENIQVVIFFLLNIKEESES